MRRKYALCGALLSAIMCQAVSAAPILQNVAIMENGNNVEVTFDISDLRGGSIDDLPRDFILCLLEDDLFFDDVLGMIRITLDDSNTTPTAGGNTSGGYTTTNPIMLTFLNASNAATGNGDDYILELKPQPVPEPSSGALVGVATLGLLGLGRRRHGPGAST